MCPALSNLILYFFLFSVAFLVIFFVLFEALVLTISLSFGNRLSKSCSTYLDKETTFSCRNFKYFGFCSARSFIRRSNLAQWSKNK